MHNLIRFQWQEEICKNLPRVPSHHVFVMTKSKDCIENAKVLILSYDLMGRQKGAIKAIGFGVAIMVISSLLIISNILKLS